MLLCFSIIELQGAGDDVPQSFLTAWSLPLVPLIGLALTLLLYLRGWRAAYRTRPRELPAWRAASFVAGIAALWIAIASPIDAFDDYLLTAHMIQHFILMSIAPPLIVLGAPTVPLLRGLPRSVRFMLRPLFRARWLRTFARFLIHPVVAWLLMNVAYLGWHVPAAFELTFQSENIHQLEHACFFLTSVAFWWVVFAPWPARRLWPRWTMIPYLLTRRRPQYGVVCDACLLRTRALPVLCECCARVTAYADSGPGRCGRRDVGSEFAGLYCAGGGHHHRSALTAVIAACFSFVQWITSSRPVNGHVSGDPSFCQRSEDSQNSMWRR